MAGIAPSFPASHPLSLDGLSVLHAVTRLRRGGSELNLLNMMRFEVGAGCDVHLAVGAGSETAGVPSEVTVHQLGSLSRRVAPLRDVRAVLDLQRLAPPGRFDVVHSHQSKAGIVARVALKERAVLVHTVHMASFGPGYGPIASRLFLAAERQCALHTDYIVVVGDELADRYLAARVGKRDQYLTIRSPIDVDRFAAIRDYSADDRRAARERFGLSPDSLVVVGVGALERRKRFDLLIRRLASALNPGAVELAIAGTGSEAVALTRLCAELDTGNCVRFLGQVDDVPSLLGAADVLVHTATVEGVPQVVIQALAAGLPVVATEVEGLREIPQAPITVAARDGRDLTVSMIANAIRAGQPTLPLERLRSWTPHSVTAQMSSLYGLILSNPRFSP